MTPLHIKMLLHYYAIAEPYAMRHPEHATSPAVLEYRKTLIQDGLIEPVCGSLSGYRTTDRGKAYVEALCNLPLPVCKWVIP